MSADTQRGVVRVVVTGKEAVADGVAVVTLAHARGGRLPDWTPGAHVDVVLPGGLMRQYSLCGDRHDPFTYRIGVLHEARSRGGSSYLHTKLRLGDTLEIGGPRNHFPLTPTGRCVFIAGGIGITPIVPMIAKAETMGIPWTLAYGGRRRASMAFVGELTARYGDRVAVVPADEDGQLDLPRIIGDPDPSATVYCCGPPPLLDAVRRTMSSWRPHALRVERFAGGELPAPVRTGTFTVHLVRSGTQVDVPPDTTVLDAIAARVAAPLASCRQGVCGTCETRVLGGLPDHRDSVLSDAERAAGDSMMICVSRSASDSLVLDL